MQTIAPNSPTIASSRIPAALTSKPQWVLWKLQIDTTQRSKPRKLPVQTSLRPASVADPATWCNLEAVTDAIERLGRKPDLGLGFVFTGDGLCGIDLDNVVSESGEIHPQAQELLDRIPGYKEFSPSGRGIHIITLGTPPWTGRRDCGISVEVYTDRRFFTVTTNTLPGSLNQLDKPTDLSPLAAFDQTRHVSPAANEDVWAHLKCPDPQWTIERVRSLLDDLPDFPYPDWLRVGYALHHQFDGSEVGYGLFLNYSARGERYTGEADTRQLWNSIRAGVNRPLVTIATLVHMSNLHKAPPEPTVNKLPLEPLFVRLKDAKREIRSTEWVIEKFVKKESLIMIAGAPGSGKTYVALDMALSIATGKPWLDRYKTQQGAVILIACEGRDSLLRRVWSWEALKNAGEDVEDAFVTNAEIVVGTSPDAPNSSEALARFTEQMGVQPESSRISRRPVVFNHATVEHSC